MNSKHPDNDIDRLFKSAVDSQETEPSDTFWNKAYEDIIQRENRMYNRQVSRWKTIAYFLAAAVVVIALYLFYMHGRINGIQNQLTQVEQQEAIPVTAGKTVTGITTPVTATPAAPNTTEATNTVTVSNTMANTIVPVGQSTLPNKLNTAASAADNTTLMVANTAQPKIAGSNTTHSNPGSINVGANTSSSNNNPIGFGGNTLPGSYYGNTKTENTASPAAGITAIQATATQPIQPKPDTIAAANPIATPATVKPSDAALLATTTPDTTTPVIRTNEMLASKSILKNIYISAFFSPELSGERINNNTPSGNETAGMVNAREDDGFTYTAGIKAGYDLSKHWSVFTGVYYHSYSFTVKPNEIQASWYNNQVDYLMVTSAGTLNLPCNGYRIIGDSIKASGHTTMSYISIPLQARYTVTGSRHIGFYIDGGFTANILQRNNAFTYWQYWQSSYSYDGSATLQTCEGLEKSFYAYNAGVGITYKIAKGWSIFGEPSFQGAITPENKSTAITTYPYLLGLEMGVTCHF